jgi:hypothetical protein
MAIMLGIVRGVFSRRFGNGGFHLLFWGFINLNSVFLAYIYWPMKAEKVREIKIEEKETKEAK